MQLINLWILLVVVVGFGWFWGWWFPRRPHRRRRFIRIFIEKTRQTFFSNLWRNIGNLKRHLLRRWILDLALVGRFGPNLASSRLLARQVLLISLLVLFIFLFLSLFFDLLQPFFLFDLLEQCLLHVLPIAFPFFDMRQTLISSVAHRGNFCVLWELGLDLSLGLSATRLRGCTTFFGQPQILPYLSVLFLILEPLLFLLLFDPLLLLLNLLLKLLAHSLLSELFLGLWILHTHDANRRAHRIILVSSSVLTSKPVLLFLLESLPLTWLNLGDFLWGLRMRVSLLDCGFGLVFYNIYCSFNWYSPHGIRQHRSTNNLRCLQLLRHDRFCLGIDRLCLHDRRLRRLTSKIVRRP